MYAWTPAPSPSSPKNAIGATYPPTPAARNLLSQSHLTPKNSFGTNSKRSPPPEFPSILIPNHLTGSVAKLLLASLSPDLRPEMTPFCVKLPHQFPSTHAGRLPSVHNPSPAPNPPIHPPLTTFFIYRILSKKARNSLINNGLNLTMIPLERTWNEPGSCCSRASPLQFRTECAGFLRFAALVQAFPVQPRKQQPGPH